MTTFKDFIDSREYGEIYDLTQSNDEETGYRYLEYFYIAEYKEQDMVDPEITHTGYCLTIGNSSYDYGDNLEAAERHLWDEFAQYECQEVSERYSNDQASPADNSPDQFIRQGDA